MNRLPAAAFFLTACAACASTPSATPAAPGPAPNHTAPNHTAPTHVSAPAGPRQVLRGVQCLDPAMARSWIDLDSHTLLVDAGRYKYRITVSNACSATRWSQVLVFRGDPVTGRVCGNIGDAIVTRDYPCTIQRMDLLDKAQYKALLDERDAARKAKRAARQ